MIAQFWLWLLSTIAQAVLDLFPEGPEPAPVLGGVSSAWGTVVSSAASMGAWIPWSVVGAALAVVAAVLVTAGVIKLVRIVASFVTLGGGSAA